MATRRDWLAIYPRLIRLPKFRSLTGSAQLSLIYVWALAGDEDPEATWSSLDRLAGALELHGRPRADVQELVEGHWLDVVDGRVQVHDWDDHQRAATRAAQRAWEADRKRTWRLQAAPPNLSPDTPSLTPHHITSQESGTTGDVSGTSPGPGTTNGEMKMPRQGAAAPRHPRRDPEPPLWVGQACVRCGRALSEEDGWRFGVMFEAGGKPRHSKPCQETPRLEVLH